jgi:protein-tyrosine phosphatase
LGVTALVRLADTSETGLNADQVLACGLLDLASPIEDFSVPTFHQVLAILTYIAENNRAGKAVAVSCGSGRGRTGTVLSCYLVSRSRTAADAIATMAKLNRKPETQEQEEFVRLFEQEFSQPSSSGSTK